MLLMNGSRCPCDVELGSHNACCQVRPGAAQPTCSECRKVSNTKDKTSLPIPCLRHALPHAMLATGKHGWDRSHCRLLQLMCHFALIWAIPNLLALKYVRGGWAWVWTSCYCSRCMQHTCRTLLCCAVLWSSTVDRVSLNLCNDFIQLANRIHNTLIWDNADRWGKAEQPLPAKAD